MQVKKLRSTAVDLTGNIFGRLTAIEATEKRTKSGSIIWLCRCECENYVEVSRGDLTRGNQVSCGCQKRENNKNVYKHLHLVEGTCLEFLEKRLKRCDNKTGRTGVSMLNNKYRASIGFKGKKYHLGTYETLEEASRAREIAEKEIHGAFLEVYYANKAKADNT